MESRTAKLEAELKALRADVATLKKARAVMPVRDKAPTGIQSNKALAVPPGIFPVVYSPYLDPSDLMVTLPAYNQDLGLLKQRQHLGPSFDKGVVQISGMVEAQVAAIRNPDGSKVSDVDLSEVELHLNADLHPWVMGFMSFAYDNTPLPNTNIRLNNSGIYLDKGFITIGNLDESPFYMTVGQRYVAFGHYDNYMATAPLTRLLGRVRARDISISYQHPGDTGFYATIFAFRGDTQVIGNQNINQIGGSFGYEFKNQYLKTDVGIDYINNLADSEGMIALAFQQNATLYKRAPAIAIHAKAGWGPYTVLTEYIAAVSPFDARNLSFNGAGAKPMAWDNVFVYSFKIGNIPSDFSIGYTLTRDAMALFMPERRYSMNYNLVILKDTILSLEYRRDYNYAATNTAFAQGVSHPSEGGYSNTVTGMLTYYF